jgi:hypothetical protein
MRGDDYVVSLLSWKELEEEEIEQRYAQSRGNSGRKNEK